MEMSGSTKKYTIRHEKEKLKLKHLLLPVKVRMIQDFLETEALGFISEKKLK